MTHTEPGGLQETLNALDLDNRLIALGQKKTALADKRRELAELKQTIPLWDRVVFFSDSPDEVKEAALEAQCEALEADFNTSKTQLDHDLAGVEATYKPFEIGRRIEACADFAREKLLTAGERTFLLTAGYKAFQKELITMLEALATNVIEFYAPGFDGDALTVLLNDEEACTELSRQEASQPTPDPLNGFAPIDLQSLQVLMAREVLASRFYHNRTHIKNLEAKYQEAVANVATAREAVPLTETLNVFSKGDHEQALEAVEKERRERAWALNHTIEESRYELLASMSVYPPLTIYLSIIELLGVLSGMETVKETILTRTGAAQNLDVVSPAGLVQEGLNRLRRSFARTFPGVTLPADVARRKAWRQPKAYNSASATMLRRFGAQMTQREGDKLIEQAFIYTAMAGSLSMTRRAVSAKITWFDRLIFWSDTADESREDELQKREQWHRDATGQTWDKLLALAKEVGRQQEPLLIRDIGLDIDRTTNALSTSGGSSSSPRSCPVYGKEHVNAALSHLRDNLSARYDFQGNRQGLMQEVIATLDQPLAEHQAPVGYQRLVARLAQHLESSDFKRSYTNVNALRASLRHEQAELNAVKENISLLDKINVFSDTEDESRRDAIKKRLEQQQSDLKSIRNTLDSTFDNALWGCDPRAFLFYNTERVGEAITKVSAYNQSYTVTRKVGKRTRTETRYRCVLSGKTDAISTARWFNTSIVRIFGELPGYHTLLERWMAL